MSKVIRAILTTSSFIMLLTQAIATNDHDFSPEARRKVRYAYAFGGYIPTVAGGFTGAIGTDFWSSYRYPVGTWDLRTGGHGQTFVQSDPAGSESRGSISTQEFDALYRLNAFYFGPGISFVSEETNPIFFPFSHPWETMGTFTAGFDFTTRFFVEAVYQFLGQDPYKGVSIGVGYRF